MPKPMPAITLSMHFWLSSPRLRPRSPTMRRATERLRNAGISLSGKCHYCFEPTPNHTRNCPTCKGPTMADARERATEAFLKAGGWDDVADGRDCDSGFDEAVEIIEQALLAYA